MNTLRRVILFAGAASLFCACPSFTTLGSARTLDQGQFQFMAAPEVQRLPLLLAPQVDLAARYGLTDWTEIGAKVWWAGFEVDSKIGLIRSPSTESGFNLSLDPGAGYFGSHDTSGVSPRNVEVLSFYLPLLLGFRFNGHELVLGPKAVDQYYFTNTGSFSGKGNTLFVGSTMGIAFKVSRSFRLMPELSLLFLAAAPRGAIVGTGTPVFEAGLGFLFGGS